MKMQQTLRSPQLRLLSNEHRDGLLFVSRIRKNIEKVAAFRLRNYVCWYWKNHIRPHFFLEETLLLPYLMASHPLAKQLEDEHMTIRGLVLSLDKAPDPQTFKALCDVIEAHIRFEEEEFYTYLELHLGEDHLNNIYQKMASHLLQIKEWEDEFWESKVY